MRLDRCMLALAAALIAACATAPDAPERGVLFDDFTYASPANMAQNGWILRTAPGWPGVPGATWGSPP